MPDERRADGPAYQELERRCREAEARLARMQADEANQAHIKQVLLAIRNVNQLIVQETDRGRLIERACGTLTETLGYHSAWIALLDEPGRAVERVASAGFDGRFEPMRRQILAGDHPACMRAALASDEPVTVVDPDLRCHTCLLGPLCDGRAALATRLQAGGRTHGFLAVSVPAAYAGDEEQRSLFAEVAGDLAFALRRIEIEERRAATEREVAEILDSISDAFFALDEDLTFTYFNRAAERQLGRRVEDVVGRPFGEAFPEARGSVFERNYREALRTRRPMSFEVFFEIEPYRNWYDVRVHPSGRGIAVYFLVTTDRKGEEEVLRESETKFSLAFRTSPYAITITRASDGRILEVNDSFVDYTGYPREEAIGRSTVDLGLWTDPADRDRVVSKLAAGERVIGEEFRFRRRDGGLLVGLFSAGTMQLKGETCVLSSINDITERKRTEEALRESEARLRGLLDTTRDWVFELDTRAVCTFASSNVQGLMGYTAEEIVGRLAFDLMPPEDGARARAVFESVLVRGARISELEHALLARSGEAVHFETNAIPLHGERGEVTGYFGVCRDISERRLAERLLQAREERFRLLYENSPLGYQSLDAEGRVLEVNQAWQAALGYERNEVIGRWFGDLLVPEEVEAFRGKFPRFLSEGETHVEWRMRRKDGKPVLIAFDGRVARGVDGRVKQAHCVLNDITDSRRIEHALRVLAEIGGAVDEEFFRFLTRELAQALDVRYAMLAVIRPEDPETAHTIAVWSDAGFADDFSYALAGTPCWSVREQGACIYPRDVRARFPEDALLVEMQAESYWGAPLRGSSGEVIGIMAVLDDQPLEEHPQSLMLLTSFAARAAAELERRQAEAERDRLQAQLLQAQKMESVGRLAGGVAHDFNNMLGVILGNAELALEHLQPGEPLQTELSEIQKAARRSAELTRQLLAFARKQTVHPRILDVNDVVEGTLKMIERLIGEDIDLVWRPCADLWPVRMDPGQIDQILTNLTVNARDAISGVGKVTIETATTSFDDAYCAEHLGFAPGDYVMLAVSDDGCGMSEEVLASLFEPFFTTKERGKGTGLGLATIYGIVKQNHGFINVYSEPGHGTTVKVYLPRHAGRPTEMEETVGGEPAPTTGETILLVEDEPAVLRLAATMLQRLGYQVLTAHTPSEAIELAEQTDGEIHLLLTDVVMPEMNGRDLARCLLSFHPEMKRLFTSGYTANVIAHHGVLEEGVHFIQKPFSLQDLATKVRVALGAGHPRPTQRRVLLVDDDRDLCYLLQRACARRGHVCHAVHDAAAAVAAATRGVVDVLVVDLNLRGASGLGLLRDLRSAGVRAPAILWSGAAEDAAASTWADLDVRACLQKSEEFAELVRAIERA